MPARLSPYGIRIDKSGGTGMDIDWSDGHKSHYSFQYLRDACPCATCEEDREKTGARYGEAPKPKNALPMYRDPARPTDVNMVGKYAINFSWNDSHNSGLYTWEFLREWCPCEECKGRRAGGL
jgi:DUF971 family protein